MSSDLPIPDAAILAAADVDARGTGYPSLLDASPDEREAFAGRAKDMLAAAAPLLAEAWAEERGDEYEPTPMQVAMVAFLRALDRAGEPMPQVFAAPDEGTGRGFTFEEQPAARRFVIAIDNDGIEVIEAGGGDPGVLRSRSAVQAVADLVLFRHAALTTPKGPTS